MTREEAGAALLADLIFNHCKGDKDPVASLAVAMEGLHPAAREFAREKLRRQFGAAGRPDVAAWLHE